MENATNKEELKAKYKPLIAEAKAKYLAKDKLAKEEVAKEKEIFKAEYAAQLAEFDSRRPEVVANAKAKYNEAFAALMQETDERWQSKNRPFIKTLLRIKFLKSFILSRVDNEFDAKYKAIKKEYHDEVYAVSKKLAKRN